MKTLSLWRSVATATALSVSLLTGGAAAQAAPAPAFAPVAQTPAANAAAHRDYIADWLRGRITAAKDPNSPAVDPLRAALYQWLKIQAGPDQHATIEAVVKTMREPDGGFTWSPVTGIVPTLGFAVSPFPKRSKTVDLAGMSDVQIIAAVRDYATQNNDLLAKPGYYLGGWNDPATGIVYLDVSTVLDNPFQARKLCLTSAQIAFFDLQTMSSVTAKPALLPVG
ncbi:hypothetical protein [Arthrobacter russicus]|uniref:Lipoprotein n=1 Tax=Arthrobacter russicus TaxID=172040 RepID=A0ABU1JC83_9MICC|nr:hypothetical protein [Arthrobacter russicus]MDR6270037.1 hypothetical protein [Arthrobacter russicus]